MNIARLSDVLDGTPGQGLLMINLKTTLLASALGLAALGVSGTAHAGPCLGSPSCTLDGQTFTTSPIPPVTSNGGLTFLAQFTTADQSLDNQTKGQNTTIGIIQLVEDYLSLLGDKGVSFLGRAGDGTDLPTGDNGVTVTGNGNLTGTWTLHLASGAADFDTRIASDLDRVRTYTLDGDRLNLALEGNGGIYTWQQMVQ
jgi:hypothetical protein